MGNQCGPAFPNPTTNPDLETYGRNLSKPRRNPPQPLKPLPAHALQRAPEARRTRRRLQKYKQREPLLFLRPTLTHPTTHVTTKTGSTPSHPWRTQHALHYTGAKHASRNRTSDWACLGIPGTYPGSESMRLRTGHDDGPECEWPPGLGVGRLSTWATAVSHGS